MDHDDPSCLARDEGPVFEEKKSYLRPPSQALKRIFQTLYLIHQCILKVEPDDFG
ncbi:hypothetical protein [uncultured Methylobacterium sp.]|uniref:hypothetical protein n=1 Tax=uncultured Methylobacterium sp. TaxID=157278 RepID=UPI00259A234D|nr:hypothetical protein [uncultured Methylobacterium sp.]